MGKTVNHKAKMAKKETVKVTQAPVPASAAGGKKGKKSFRHHVPQGMRARESDERKIALRNKIEIKRLLTHVQKAKDTMEGKEEDPRKDEWKYRVDPKFDLKGAARVAREAYPDPNQKQREKKRDLMSEYAGRYWEIPEGRDYLKALVSYGSALHNLVEKSHDALQQFEEALQLDPEDHAGAQQQILRLHLDRGDAVKARLTLERFPENKSACFLFNHALIEFISWSLQDEGTSKEQRDTALAKAIESNPYLVWMLAYHDVYEQIVTDVEQLLEDDVQEALVKPGSVEDAMLYFESDVALWVETEGTIEWLQEFIVEKELEPPSVPPLLVDEGKEQENEEKEENERPGEEEEEDGERDVTIEDLHAMYLDMFHSGCEEIESRLTGGQ